MSKRIITLIIAVLLIILAGMMLASCGSSISPTTSSSAGSSAGQVLMQSRCTVCHSPIRITSAHKTADQWKVSVDRMLNKGAQLSPQEEQVLVNYLAQNYK